MNDVDPDLAEAEKVAGQIEATQKAGRRRRSSFTPEIAEVICERIIMGESLRQICQDPKMPARSSIFVWLQQHKEFADQYRWAKQALIEDLAYEILHIADDSTNDWVDRRTEDGQTRRVFNPDNIRQAKLRIAARKWHLARLMPKKYGLE